MAKSAKKPATTGFNGFEPAAFAFFRGLTDNNERAWFLEHKAEYEAKVIAPFRQLLASLRTTMSAAGIPLAADPANAIFRIHRDVRFSNDKTPYKTHAGAIISRDGSKGRSGIVYIHIAAGGCFCAAGFWQPDRDLLGALREAIYVEPKRFAAIQSGLAKAGLTLDSEDSLSRLPRGYEDATDPALSAALRLKSFVVRRPLQQAHVESPALVDDVMAFTKDCLPFLQFGWQALTVLNPTALTRQK